MSNYPVAIKLETTLKERIKKIASIRNRTSHFIMKEAINQYIEREEEHFKALQELEQAALASLANYEKTGLHLTGKEVCDWLDTWGTDNEAEAPQCHK